MKNHIHCKIVVNFSVFEDGEIQFHVTDISTLRITRNLNQQRKEYEDISCFL